MSGGADLVRWKITSKLSNTKLPNVGQFRVLYYYARLWDRTGHDAVFGVLGHGEYDVKPSGRINEKNMLVDVPEEDKGQLLADNAPSRETRS